MFRCQGSLAVIVLLFAGIISPLSAQVAASNQPTCLEQAAAKIRLHSKVTVFKLNGEKQGGRLGSIDLSNSHLLLKSLLLEDSTGTLFRQDEIAKIQYSKPGKFNPGYMVAGLFLGGLAGAGIGALVEGRRGNEGSFKIGGFIGLMVGAGAGLLGGAIIPTVVSSTRTIECK